MHRVFSISGLACVLLLSVGVLLSACDSAGSESDVSPALVPLTQGNQWVAEVQGDSLWAVVGQDGSLEVTRKMGQDSVLLPLRVERRQEGLLIRRDGEEVFLFRYPVETGTTYAYTDSEGTDFEVSVSRASVNVPAGFFESLLYTIRSSDRETPQRVWVRPGFGPVRVDLHAFGSAKLVSTNVDAGGYP